MTLNELLSRMSSNEISEQMAYDLAQDPKFVQEHEREERYRAFFRGELPQTVGDKIG